jgi:folate-binding protein YgfZ
MLSPASPPFKASRVEGGLRRLSGFSLLAASGPDSGAFLQAQLMNDVRKLDVGQWQWNGWLTPKGRVVCLFALWRRGEQDYVALLPDFPAAELQPLLQRFVFRSKLSLQVVEDYEIAGAEASARVDGPAARDLVLAQAGGYCFDFGGDASERWLWVGPAGAQALPPAQAGFDDAWRAADLAHGLPRLEPGQREAWTPQMLSLQRLHAFSLSKGCYPGQEIVARTHYLGQSKRELVRLRGGGLVAGASVEDADGRVLGTVACAAGEEALAVLQADRTAGPRLVGGVQTIEAPLLEGLQRPV